MANDPLTPQKVEAAIMFYINQITGLVAEYAEAADAKAITDAEFKLAWAKARRDHRDIAAIEGWKVTESILDDNATIITYDALKARLVAIGKEESVKLAARAAQSKLDGARSLGSNITRALVQ